ncbi:MAG: hypothetical protein HY898_36050 [Deltaproteobacteria bacterium]|nr:hypothetical protein [Deltaproteobacteria bacterium]
MRPSPVLTCALLAVWCGPGCASINETRTETVVGRSVTGSSPEPAPQYDGPRVTARFLGNKIEATVEWITVCGFADVKASQVKRTTKRSTSGAAYVFEGMAIALGAALVVDGSARNESDDEDLGQPYSVDWRAVEVTAGMLIALPAAIAMTADAIRSLDSEDVITRSVRGPEKYFACDTRRMADASLRVRFADGRHATARTGAKGTATVEVPAPLDQQQTLTVDVQVDAAPEMRVELKHSDVVTEFW